MTSTAALTGSHLRTYNSIFQHPVSPDLGWRDVEALLRQLGQVHGGPNGNLKVSRNGHVLILQPPRTKDVSETDDVMAVRHFLEQSEPTHANSDGTELHWLLVIDHREARIYRSTAPGAFAQLIRPHAAEDLFHHGPNAKPSSRGQEKPRPSRYFEPVAGVLNGAGKILVFGSGTGTSIEMDLFVAWLGQHRPELAKRIVGTVVVDEHHLTEAELLAQAREFYASIRNAPR
jgi:hypothetical protein